MKELEWYHANFNTPDGLSLWPVELDGVVTVREEEGTRRRPKHGEAIRIVSP